MDSRSLIAPCSDTSRSFDSNTSSNLSTSSLTFQSNAPSTGSYSKRTRLGEKSILALTGSSRRMSKEYRNSRMLSSTFGIEVEVMLVYHIPTFIHLANDHASLGVTAIHNALQASNVRLSSLDPLEGEQYDQNIHWDVENDASGHLNETEMAAYPLPRDAWNCECVEIISPVFSYDVDDWETEIANVLSTIQKCFSPNEALVFCNESTGLHVHVGNGRTGYPFATVKKVLQLATAFERSIDVLHSTDRIVGDENANAEYLNPPSSYLQDGKSTLLEWCQTKIGQTSTIEELARLFTKGEKRGKAFIYNLDNLLPPKIQGTTKKNTIEFRQHRGTLDFLEVRAWIDTTIRLVLAAHETDEHELMTYISNAVKHCNSSPHSFLQDIGVHKRARNYYKKVTKLLPLSKYRMAEVKHELAIKKSKNGLYWWRHPNGRLQYLAEVVQSAGPIHVIARAVREKADDKQQRGCYGLPFNNGKTYHQIASCVQDETTEVVEVESKIDSWLRRVDEECCSVCAQPIGRRGHPCTEGSSIAQPVTARRLTWKQKANDIGRITMLPIVAEENERSWQDLCEAFQRSLRL